MNYGLEAFIAQEGFFANRKLNKTYKNPDGSLNAEGKRCYDMYLKSKQLEEKMIAEADKIIKKDKQLKYDFGGAAHNIDDWDMFDLALQEHNYNAELKSFRKIRDEYEKYGDYKTISIGKKLSESMKPAQEGLFEKKDKPPVDAKKAEAFVLKAVKEIIHEVYISYDPDLWENCEDYKPNPNFKPPFQLTYNKDEDENEIKYLIYPKTKDFRSKLSKFYGKMVHKNINDMTWSILNQKYKKETKEFGIKYVKANKENCCVIIYFKK